MVRERDPRENKQKNSAGSQKAFVQCPRRVPYLVQALWHNSAQALVAYFQSSCLGMQGSLQIDVIGVDAAATLTHREVLRTLCGRLPLAAHSMCLHQAPKSHAWRPLIARSAVPCPFDFACLQELQDVSLLLQEPLPVGHLERGSRLRWGDRLEATQVG